MTRRGLHIADADRRKWRGPHTYAPGIRLARRPCVGRASLIALVAALIAGCNLGSHAVPDGGNPTSLGPSDGCSGACHGAGASIAPPRDTQGHSNLSAIGVGAHAAHLQSSDWHKRFACEACHKVPAEVGDPGHILVANAQGQMVRDPLPAEVEFTGLGSGASWDHDAATCTNSYCHGDTLHQVDATGQTVAGAGGTITKPIWTTVDGSQSACGSCHGNPPPAPHPQNTDCGLCHQSMNPGDFAAGKISYPELHIDGKVEVVSTAACDSCHGGGGQYAPPKDAHGNTATTAPGVGTHAAHMTSNSTWHAAIQCNECHLVPGSTTDQTHLDGINEVFLDGATPTGGTLQIPGAKYDASTRTCTNTFCHGGGNSLLSGGTKTSPIFTAAGLITNMGNVDCQACHGMPPTTLPTGGAHPADSNCGKCHPTMTPGNNTTITYPALHINGTVETINDQTCNFCHGDPNATPIAGDAAINAPPLDTTGGMLTTLRSVGAHQAHMGISTWRAPIACGECHLVPAAVLAKGHIDSPTPAEVIFGNKAGTTATWNGSTCSNVYCHGATLVDGTGPAGGNATKPVWTVVNGSQSQCGSCHGLPPPPPHTVDTDCGKCHPTMTAGQPGVITDPSRHIDGNLDVLGDAACNSCHGSTTGGNAPPKDTLGNTLTTARGVGAHQSHLNPTSPFFKAIACTDCHLVPATVNSVGHIDTPLPAEVIFSQRAGSSPTWNGAACANVYCHGSTLTDGSSGAGGTATSPLWAKVDGTQAACTSCHGNPPPLPHVQNPDCGQCHADVMAGQPTKFVDATKHIDGNLDVNANQACNSCHGDHTSTPASNGDKVNAPPFDSSGSGSLTSLIGVGAHQAHMGASSFGHAAVTCAECHLVPATVNSVGHIDTPLPAEMTFTGIAAGSTWNGSSCSSYCHGSTLAAGGTATNPLWTKVDGTQNTCASCHGNPPPSPHPNNSDCGACHPDVQQGSPTTFTNAAQHINGTTDVTSGSQHPAGYNMVTMHGYDADKTGFSTCATASCHGTALTGGSTGGPSCATVTGCHDKVGSGSTWQTQCTFCHGDITTPAGNGAPPQGVLGATAATDPTVGAHAIHLGATATHAAWDCTMCHTKPTNALTPGHIDGTGSQVQAELSFSSLNPSSAYSFTAYTCATNYCHGTGAATKTSPAWTSTTALTCASCHAQRPSTGEHQQSDHRTYACSTCHHTTIASGSTTITNLAAHINGLKDVAFSSPATSGTYNASTKSCSGLPGGCHGTKTW